MSKAIMGAAEIAAAIGLEVAMDVTGVGAIAGIALSQVMWSLAASGASLLAGSLASALTGNRGMGITTRQPAAYRQVIYGEQRVGGVLIYASTTGNAPGIFNQVIVMAGHVSNALVNLYLDGRQVFWEGDDGGYTTTGGYGWGGWADDNDHVGPDGNHYNFGGNVYAEARYGTQEDGDVIAGLTANDANWAASEDGSPYLGGCTYFYLHCYYDSTLFPQMPEVRVTIQGKSDIYDPRTGDSGYSCNWALIFNDILQNTEYGLGAPSTAVNTDQLIAAANVCDEQIQLTSGLTESQWTSNLSFDTSSTPGDILDSIIPDAAGRVSLIAGQWNIFPAYWQGASFSFDESVLVDKVSWEPYRSYRDLFNHVSGTFTCPSFPYSVTGNEYDTNGFAEDGSRQDNFNYSWQRTAFPPYAADTLHGYSADEFTAQDGGVELWQDLNLKSTISVGQAQRVAKVNLLRNRFQGQFSASMSMAAYQTQPVDVMQFNMAALGMTNELLEITGFNFQVKLDDNKPPRLYTQINAQLTDPSIYEWDYSTEELTILDAQAGGTGIPTIVAPPTDITLDSGADTAVVGADGVVIPRILVSWNAPQDAWVTEIEIQYQATGASTWIDSGLADVANFSAYITGVVSGDEYNVRIRSVRPNGAESIWLEQDSYTVSTTLSEITSSGLNPNSPSNIGNTAVIDSVVDSDGTTADIRIYGAAGGVGTSWTNYTGQGNYVEPSGTITGLAFSTLYYVVLDTVTGDYMATVDYNDALPDSYLYLGYLTTCSSSGTGGVSGGGGTGTGGVGNPRLPIQQV